MVDLFSSGYLEEEEFGLLGYFLLHFSSEDDNSFTKLFVEGRRVRGDWSL